MQTKSIGKGQGLGQLIGSVLAGDKLEEAGLKEGRAAGQKNLYNHARALTEHDKLQARQSITPDMFSGLSSSLPEGMTGDLASLLLRGGDFNLDNFAKGAGTLQKNSARTGAMDNVDEAGLPSIVAAAMQNAIASGTQMPAQFSRNQSGTLNRYTGSSTDVPRGTSGGSNTPHGISSALISHLENLARDEFGGIDPALYKELSGDYIDTPTGNSEPMLNADPLVKSLDPSGPLGPLLADPLQYNGPPIQPPAEPNLTATGPNGEKVVLKNGQWVPM